jgi:hypothetical protein
MDIKSVFSEQLVTGWLLILSGLIFAIGGTLYSGRAILKWPVSHNPAYLSWERGFVIAALIVVLLGLVLLERSLTAAGEAILAPGGLTLFLTGAFLALVAEAFFINRQEWVYPLVILFAVLAFLGQVCFGASLLLSGYLPAWVGWATIIWNLAWLVILPIARPQDIYYPWLHYTAPLLIGIMLLIK